MSIAELWNLFIHTPIMTLLIFFIGLIILGAIAVFVLGKILHVSGNIISYKQNLDEFHANQKSDKLK